jgi:hypothetical protein
LSGDAALVRFLNPLAYQVDENRHERIVDSYIRALTLLRATHMYSVGNVNWVMLLRFDLMIKQPAPSLNIDWGRMNFGWRDSGAYWTSEHIVSDLWYLFPASRLNDMARALDDSGNTPQGWPGSGHYTWRIINERFGESSWHFIDDGYSTSWLDGWQCNQQWGGMPFFIMRNCPRDGTMCAPEVTRCSGDSPRGIGNGDVLYGAGDVGVQTDNGFALDGNDAPLNPPIPPAPPPSPPAPP